MSASSRRAIVATLALAGYSIFLLDFTYLEPLPWRAGQLGVVLLLVAAFGAGMLVGWRWPALLLLAACGIGVLYPSASLQQEGRWWSEHGSEVDGVLVLLVLVPVAIGLGALCGGRLGPRSRIAGAATLALPLIVVAWAGFREASPTDVEPAHPRVISYPAYRGVKLGEHLPHALTALGKPDGGSLPDADFTFGSDLFEFSAGLEDNAPPAHYSLAILEIRDPNAQTAEGVGIGDNLGLAASRYRAHCGYDWVQDGWQPECRVYYDTQGFQQLIFIGDPIEWIKLG
jgi:hypothetical protein